MVRAAQQFINTTYDNGAKLGISKLDENGQTSWTVMYALTRALQYELGISGLSNNFGPGTLSTLHALLPHLPDLRPGRGRLQLPPGARRGPGRDQRSPRPRVQIGDQDCFERTVTAHDDLITELSNRHNMRKALIQTTAYWEMRHISPDDELAWAAVITAFNTTRQYIRDTSTGIAKQRAVTLIGAWNHALDKGYGSGQPRRDVSVDEDKYNAWKQAYDSETYALTSVALIHRWDIDGKPGGDDDSPALRQPTLGYTDQEIYEVLRRYQGPGDVAYEEAKKRMGLYYVMEKYNSISRNL